MLLILLFFSFLWSSSFFFFNDTATTEIYTLSLHDALPIPRTRSVWWAARYRVSCAPCDRLTSTARSVPRSEEHTSELQSPCNLVCRLLLEKKNKKLVEVFHQKKNKKETTPTH